MLFSLAVLIGLLPLPVVLGGQIPVVDGVIGGVPSDDSFTDFVNLPKGISNATTPGKLRVVENSGICGESLLPIYVSPIQMSLHRNDSWCLPSIWIRRYNSHGKHLVRHAIHVMNLTLPFLLTGSGFLLLARILRMRLWRCGSMAV